MSTTVGVKVKDKKMRRRLNGNIFNALLTVGIIFGIIIAQLLISVWVSAGAYEIVEAKQLNIELDRTIGTLEQEVRYLEAPQNLAIKAEAIGMVNNANPAYLRLSDGVVLGSPQPATNSDTIFGTTGSLVPVQINESIMARANSSTAVITPTPTPAPTVSSINTTPAANTPQVLTNGIPGVQTR